jgi:2-phosphosulfolactate phosphatase
MKIDVILTPAELPGLARRDLRQSACVVFDILRATSTFVTALHHGAAAIVPVSEIAEAVVLRQRQPDVLLAGERDGVRIRAAQSGGTDFDFGNSPREFSPEKVRGKTIVSTTTNGTRALRACVGAKHVLAAAFLNLAATADFLRQNQVTELLLVAAGTGVNVADEDVLAAGALIDLQLTDKSIHLTLSDSAQIAQTAFARSKTDLLTAIGSSQNGRRLLMMPELREDVAYCAQRDIFDLVVSLDSDDRLGRVTIK